MTTVKCYGCEGKGEEVVIDIKTGYGERMTCRTCEGVGSLEEPHPLYF